jgi:hypothetical protein
LTPKQFPPLADEVDPVWDDEPYWSDFAYRYVALSDVAEILSVSWRNRQPRKEKALFRRGFIARLVGASLPFHYAPVGSFSSCPVSVAHEMSASGLS